MDDFLISDPAIAQSLETEANTRNSPEKLLVRQDGEQVDIALYIDHDIVTRLKQDDPTERLHGGNLADFCTTLEGISHFLYLTWNAGHERGVSLLELEMQAEVDKFVASAFLFGSQDSGYIPGTLSTWLFDNPSFADELDAESLTRYQNANYYASKYCSYLENQFLRERRGGSMVNELRRFYRLRQKQKIERIKSTH